MTDQLSLFNDARAKRDAGISAAMGHADAVNPKWSHMAYAFLLSYAATHGCFTSEELRIAAYAADAVPPPPDERAWGGVVVRGVRAGVLRRDRFVNARSPKVHCTVGAQWRVVPAGGMTGGGMCRKVEG